MVNSGKPLPLVTLHLEAGIQNISDAFIRYHENMDLEILPHHTAEGVIQGVHFVYDACNCLRGH